MSKITLIITLALISSYSSKIIDECNCNGKVSLKNVSEKDCNKICNALNHKCVKRSNYEDEDDDNNSEYDPADAGY